MLCFVWQWPPMFGWVSPPAAPHCLHPHLAAVVQHPCYSPLSSFCKLLWSFICHHYNLVSGIGWRKRYPQTSYPKLLALVHIIVIEWQVRVTLSLLSKWAFVIAYSCETNNTEEDVCGTSSSSLKLFFLLDQFSMLCKSTPLLWLLIHFAKLKFQKHSPIYCATIGKGFPEGIFQLHLHLHWSSKFDI